MAHPYSKLRHSFVFLSVYTLVFAAHAANKNAAEAANRSTAKAANKNASGKKSYREIQSQKAPYKILTLKGKVVSFDDKNVVLEIDGRKAKIARASFPSSQKFIYNEMATAYFRLEI